MTTTDVIEQFKAKTGLPVRFSDVRGTRFLASANGQLFEDGQPIDRDTQIAAGTQTKYVLYQPDDQTAYRIAKLV